MQNLQKLLLGSKQRVQEYKNLRKNLKQRFGVAPYNGKFWVNSWFFPWIFGTITDRAFWKKIKRDNKIICADTVSVGLSYDANFEWHMLWVDICRDEQNYMPFFGTITERVFRKKIRRSALHHLYMFLCFDFFRKWRSAMVPKNGIYNIWYNTIYVYKIYDIFY